MALTYKHPDLKIYSSTPINAGTPTQQAYITPDDQFFIRNHGTIPVIDPADYRLKIQGLVNRPVELTLDDLKQKFATRSVVATLQCAGNRRRELNDALPIQTGEIIWDHDAISTTIWTGVSLTQVLAVAQVQPDVRHIAFDGLDQVYHEDEEVGFGGSIPLTKALSPDVLLAYEMNGEALGPTHGYPLRLVVPGYIGARSVKWLGSITAQTQPSANYFQTRAYRIFPPWINQDSFNQGSVNWSQGLELGELPLNSAIFTPVSGQKLRAGLTRVQGYALTGNGAQIECVEVSGDNGRTWRQAVLIGAQYQWAWRYWEVMLSLTPGMHDLVVRAYDSRGARQPEHLADVWNFKGYLNNAWHRVRVKVE